MHTQAQAVRQAAQKPSGMHTVLQYRTATNGTWRTLGLTDTPSVGPEVAIVWRIVREATLQVDETSVHDGCLVPAGTYIFRHLLGEDNGFYRVPDQLFGAPVLTTVALDPDELEEYIPVTAQG